MMDLLKAYARQVVSYHPPKQRDELFDEIYDSLCEEYSDRQAGEPVLTEAGFLNRFKQHPMRYATDLVKVMPIACALQFDAHFGQEGVVLGCQLSILLGGS